MRITQTRHPQQSDVSPPMTAEEKEEFPEEKYGRGGVMCETWTDV